MTLQLNWWEGGSDESKRKSISDALTISGEGILTNPTGHHQQVIMNSSSNLYGLQQQRPSQNVQPLSVQENGQSSGNGHHPSILGHQVNGSSATNPRNGHSYSSSNQYQVEVRSSGSNVLLTSESGHPVLSDPQYQYPLEPVYGCPGLDSNPGSWSCFTGLEPKSKIFYLLSSLIIMGIAIMILTLIAAVVVFHQCEFTLKTIPLTLFFHFFLFSLVFFSLFSLSLSALPF